ncbi:MAG: hypothetical protein ACJ749_10880 [Flavisolibacter sp.]
MENKLQLEDIEKAVSAHFSGNDINKDQLRRISKSIAAITKSGLEVIDWSIFGQPPFERFVIEAQLPSEKRSALQNVFNENYKEILIMRKGIPPLPNFFNVKFTI